MKNCFERDLVMLANYIPNVPSLFHALLHGITSYVKGFYKFMTMLNNAFYGISVVTIDVAIISMP